MLGGEFAIIGLMKKTRLLDGPCKLVCGPLFHRFARVERSSDYFEWRAHDELSHGASRPLLAHWSPPAPLQVSQERPPSPKVIGAGLAAHDRNTRLAFSQ